VGGNVGIGTTNATYPLAVNGIIQAGSNSASYTFMASGELKLSSIGYAHWSIYNQNGVFSIQNTSGSQYPGAPSIGTQPLTILYGGNVGIGITNPTSALQVVNTTTTNTNPLLAIQGYNVGASGSGDVTRQAMINMLRNGTSGVQNNVSSQINLGSYSTAMINYSTIDFKLGGNPAAGNNYGSTPDVNVMTLTGQGYVGIGITNPSYMLHVNSPNPAAAYFYSTGNGNQIQLQSSVGKTYSSGYWTMGHNSDDGNFYITYQNTARGAYLLYNGTGSFTGYSDRRLKEKIIDISGADMLSKLRLVKPVYFNFKNENDTHMGVIAQDIQSIFPDIVSVSSITIDDVVNPLGVCPTGLIYPLISALQEVDGQYQITKQEVVDLKSRLSSLEARLSAAGF